MIAETSREEVIRLLRHRFTSVRLRAVAYFAEHADLEMVPRIRALEQSQPLARTQVKACREAIIRIQQGAGVSESQGAVSLDARSDRGAVSKTSGEA